MVLASGAGALFGPAVSVGAQTELSGGVAESTVPRITPVEAPTPQMVPQSLVSEIQAQVGRAWSVSPEQVVLEWGRLPQGRTIAHGSQVELVGSGRGGDWVVRFRDPADSNAGPRAGVFGVRVRAGVLRTRPVAARAILNGSTLTSDDVRWDTSVHWGPLQIVALDPVGQVAQQPLHPGDPLVSPAVQTPAAVRAGDPVEVIWSSGSIQLTLTGTAASTARAGQSCAVRLDTGRRMRGIAQADGRVRIVAPSRTGSDS